MSSGFASAGFSTGAAKLDQDGSITTCGERSPDLLVTHLNPPELVDALDRAGDLLGAGGKHVGIWLYELAEAPASWRGAFKYVDEVWAPSAFNADALRAVAPSGARVRVVRFPLFALPRAAPDRARFGLPPGVCVAFTAADLKSSATRKNPIGALQAWLRAFPEPASDALWLCKISNADSHAPTQDALTAAAAERPDIRIVQDRYTPDEMLSLMASIDIVLSLHRAEGFGLTLAEGAWLEKACISTNWSAPTEFLDPDGAALIPYKLVPVDDPQGLYPRGASWADPDLDAAAEAIRTLVGSPRLRARIGVQARRHIERIFDRERWVEDLRAAVRAL